MRRPWRRFLFAAVLLAAVGVLLFAGKTLDAGVSGSPHDFSSITAIAPSGTCSACHIPHGADVYGLWTRDLTLYRTKLGMDGSFSSEPNYVHAPTIQCYDCHDSHDDTSNRIDVVPAKTDFSAGHYPQNIAFGFTKTGLGSMSEDGPGGSVPGYYENKPPYSTSPSSNYGADPNLNPDNNAQLLKTGGHYFKYVDPDGGTTTFKKGDKLPCRDCHDPHAWDGQWQAFFRKTWPTGAISSRLGSTVAASSYMANDAGTRDTLSGGRKLCIACHGTSDGTAVNFSDIDSRYTASGAIVKPQATISEHASTNTTTPCVSCHNHNSIDVSCGECHGYPPPQYPANRNPEGTTAYAVTPERTHAFHFGKQNGSETAFSKYSFQCSICHANSAMGTKTPSNHGNDNVDVDFDLATLATTRAWIDTVPLGHPARFQPFTGSAYTRTTCGPGGRGGVYCHSAGHDNTAVDPAVYYRNVTWGTASLKCFGCHGNSAYDNTSVRYGMPDTTDHPNTHEKHVVARGYECSVCHFNTAIGQYTNQSRAIKGTTNAFHVNGTADVDFDPAVVSGSPGYTRATKTCSVSCHGSSGNAQWGGTLSCNGCHGNQGAGKPPYWGGGDFTYQHDKHTDNNVYRIACEQCHATHSSRTQGNTNHVSGDNTPSTPLAGRYVEVKFTDNASNAWTYDGYPWTYRSVDLWTNPFLGTAPSPSYADGPDNPALADPSNNTITYTEGTCSNVWCHSNANPDGLRNAYRPVAWSTSVQRSCTLCHRGAEPYATASAATDAMSRGHWRHLDNTTYKLTCDECHSYTVQPDSSSLIAQPYDRHVNGSKNDIRGAGGIRASSIPNDSFTYDYASTKTCATNYCHSPGTDNNVSDGLPAPLQNPAWTGTLPADCTGCHGGNAASSSPMSTGAHTKHLNDPFNFKCSVCHAGTMQSNSDNVIAVYDNHVNGVVNKLAGDGHTFIPGSCVSIDCHGNKSAQWTDINTLKCSDCHLGSSDSDQYRQASDTWFANEVTGTIDNAEWLYSGHGKGSGTYASGNSAANFPGAATANGDPCLYCHLSGSTHRDPTNPFRLANKGFRARSSPPDQGWNDVCLVCHWKTSHPGYGPEPNGLVTGVSLVDQSHYGAKHGSGNDGGKFCWDCHDPHGDSSGPAGNRFMIHKNTLLRKTDGAYGYLGTAGVPTTNAPVFIDNAVGADYAKSSPGPYTGICQVCHTSAGHYTSNSGDGHNAGTRCTQCHPHDSGFAPTACKGCHGPDSVAPSSPDISAYWTSSGHGTAAIATKFGRAVECEDCHDGGHLTAGAHKTDGSVPGTPPGNINTEDWPGKAPRNDNTNPNVNTSHLKAGFIASGPADRAAVARTFDNYCATAAGCHDADYHRHNLDNGPTPRDVMRFGDHSTIADPKTKSWYTLNSYPADFFKSRSPWIDDDISLTGLADTTNYGLCVSCHDPHGTSTANTSFYPGLGTTNHMVRGNWRTESNSFCNIACHTR